MNTDYHNNKIFETGSVEGRYQLFRYRRTEKKITKMPYEYVCTNKKITFHTNEEFLILINFYWIISVVIAPQRLNEQQGRFCVNRKTNLKSKGEYFALKGN